MFFSCGKAGHSATRCPALDESFPFMLPGWSAETTPGGFIMISPRVAAERCQAETATDPGGGGESYNRISCKIRPQDPGGGAAQIATPRGVVVIEVTNSPELSIVEPQVPSRILVVLVEEARVGGTPCLGCPRVDQDLRLLAGVAKPASVTVCEDIHVSPCVGGTLSSSDLAGRLFPVVHAGIPFPVGPVGPVGLCGTLSPSDSVGPVGPYVMQSPSDFEPVGPDDPYVAGGPVGPYGTLSPSDSTCWLCWPVCCRWPRWPVCCRWPRWPIWDAVPV